MTTNQARARRILESMTNRWGKPATARDAAQALADAGLLAPEPQIIHTADELAALDPDTVLMTTDFFDPLTPVWDWLDGKGNPARGTENGLPAVVIATGEHVRAARQALEEA